MTPTTSLLRLYELYPNQLDSLMSLVVSSGVDPAFIEMIREDDFDEYARGKTLNVLHDDVRRMDKYIDWNKVTDDLRDDYIDIEIDGETYLFPEDWDA